MFYNIFTTKRSVSCPLPAIDAPSHWLSLIWLSYVKSSFELSMLPYWSNTNGLHVPVSNEHL